MVRKLPEQPADPKAIEERAVYLLSRREHSRMELQRKLTQKGFEPDAVAQVLEQLEARNWQSDARFSSSFIRQKSQQRQGPRKILAQLSERGVQGEAVQAELEAQNIDWFALAREALYRKFKVPAGTDPKERARRQRFLASRGFSMAHIRAAMEWLESDDFDPDDAIF
ncbi:regulatory protein RecX [Aliidiomarina celeris]|uniref:regulatory protein RecX n=1 Tax=Aliidiomarina celeris TaxID=2249428 RepID=UPI000DEB95E1|nr:regulatory protein RecX [Aliidiomarina celeris]